MWVFKTKEPQKTQILRAIKRKPGIPNHELAGITFKFNSRISDLRKDGFDIRTKRVWKEGKATGTFGYYLVNNKEFGDVG